jgi:hypothetical protein
MVVAAGDVLAMLRSWHVDLLVTRNGHSCATAYSMRLASGRCPLAATISLQPRSVFHRWYRYRRLANALKRSPRPARRRNAHPDGTGDRGFARPNGEPFGTAFRTSGAFPWGWVETQTTPRASGTPGGGGSVMIVAAVSVWECVGSVQVAARTEHIPFRSRRHTDREREC